MRQFTFNSAGERGRGEKERKKERRRERKKEKKKKRKKKAGRRRRRQEEGGEKRKKKNVSAASPFKPKVSIFRPSQEFSVVVQMFDGNISAIDGLQ